MDPWLLVLFPLLFTSYLFSAYVAGRKQCSCLVSLAAIVVSSCLLVWYFKIPLRSFFSNNQTLDLFSYAFVSVALTVIGWGLLFNKGRESAASDERSRVDACKWFAAQVEKVLEPISRNQKAMIEGYNAIVRRYERSLTELGQKLEKRHSDFKRELTELKQWFEKGHNDIKQELAGLKSPRGSPASKAPECERSPAPPEGRGHVPPPLAQPTATSRLGRGRKGRPRKQYSREQLRKDISGLKRVGARWDSWKTGGHEYIRARVAGAKPRYFPDTEEVRKILEDSGVVITKNG